VSGIEISALLRYAILCLVGSKYMNLFKKARKAEKKWRSAARLINIQKTKVTIIRSSAPKKVQIEHVPPWIYKKLLDEFGLASAVDAPEDATRLMRKDCPEDARAKLIHELGL
jgi:hypothetical protein